MAKKETPEQRRARLAAASPKKKAALTETAEQRRARLKGVGKAKKTESKARTKRLKKAAPAVARVKEADAALPAILKANLEAEEVGRAMIPGAVGKTSSLSDAPKRRGKTRAVTAPEVTEAAAPKIPVDTSTGVDPKEAKGQFEEILRDRDLGEIGGHTALGPEASVAEHQALQQRLETYAQQISDLPGGTSDTEEIKKVSAPITTADPLRPKMDQVAEPTPGSQAAQQAGRTARGGTGTGPLTFQGATRPETGISEDQIRELAQRVRNTDLIGPLPKGQQRNLAGSENGILDLAVKLHMSDHNKARITGKAVNGIKPEDKKLEDMTQQEQYNTVYAGHHKRLAEVMVGYGVNKEDPAKVLQGSGKRFTDKVAYLHGVLKTQQGRENGKTLTRDHKAEGITHWEHPTEKAPLVDVNGKEILDGQKRQIMVPKKYRVGEGNMPELTYKSGTTESVSKGPDGAWRLNAPVHQPGWQVRNGQSGERVAHFVASPFHPTLGTPNSKSLVDFHRDQMMASYPPVISKSEAVSRARGASYPDAYQEIGGGAVTPEAANDPKLFTQTGEVGGGTKSDYTVTRQGKGTRRIFAAAPTFVGPMQEGEERPTAEITTTSRSKRTRMVSKTKPTNKSKRYRLDPTTGETVVIPPKRGLLIGDLGTPKKRAKGIVRLPQAPVGTGPETVTTVNGKVMSREVIPDPKAAAKNPNTKKLKTIWNTVSAGKAPRQPEVRGATGLPILSGTPMEEYTAPERTYTRTDYANVEGPIEGDQFSKLVRAGIEKPVAGTYTSRGGNKIALPEGPDIAEINYNKKYNFTPPSQVQVPVESQYTVPAHPVRKPAIRDTPTQTTPGTDVVGPVPRRGLEHKDGLQWIQASALSPVTKKLQEDNEKGPKYPAFPVDRAGRRYTGGKKPTD